MTYTLSIEATVDGDIDSLWSTWTDMTSYPSWDQREEVTRLDQPFAVGATGWSKQVGGRPGGPFTITRVEEPSRWVNECPLPGGRLVMDHELTALPDNQVRLTKRYQVHGPLAVLFRLYFARGIRREVPVTLNALAVEARRREQVGTPTP